MRFLLGLVLGLALLAQTAVADPKEKDKEPKKHEPAPAAETRAPAAEAPRPVASAPDDAKTARKTARTTAKISAKAKDSPPPAATPAAEVSAAEAPTPATPAPAAAAPAPGPAASPTPAPVPAREAHRRRVSRPHKARVLAQTRSVAAALPMILPAPAPAPANRRAAKTVKQLTGAAPRSRSDKPPVIATVTRIVEVIPGPLRIALAVMAGLAALLALALAILGRRTRRLERQRQGLTEDIGLLQSALLPILPERVGRAWVSAAYRPAEGLAAGGDFYDAFGLDEHLTCLIVGDVAGHGRDAIPLTASVRWTLRAFVEGGLGPRAAVSATAGLLGPRMQGRLVTVVVAIYDARTGRLTYASAGHPPPLLLGADDELLTVCASPPIGAGAATGRRQTTVSLPPGTAACFYTDGLTDVRVPGGRLGPARLAAQLRNLGPRQGAADVLAQIVDDGDQSDDMAACLLRPMLGAEIAAPGRTEELELDAAELADERAERFLNACGVEPAKAAATLSAARELIPGGASVVMEVRRDPYGAEVTVRRPEPPVLPLVHAS